MNSPVALRSRAPVTPSLQALEHLPAAAALADLGGQLIAVNAAFLGLWRLADPAAARTAAAAGALWLDAEALRHAMTTALDEGLWQGPLTACRADGVLQPLWCVLYVGHDSDGQPEALVASFIEPVDARKDSPARPAPDEAASHAAARALAVSTESLHALLDAQGGVLHLDAACEQALGLRTEAVRGSSLARLLALNADLEGGPAVLDAAMAALAPGDSYHFESLWRSPDGARRQIEWTLARCSPCPDGPAFVLTGVGRPVGNDRMAATWRTEAMLNDAQALAQTGSWHLDLESGELQWSDEVFSLFEIDRRRFGASYEAFLGAIHPDDRATVDMAFRQSLQTRQPYRIEHRLLMPDGRVKWVEERCRSVFDLAGRPLRSAGTVQDVSQRHERDAELRRWTQMVEQSSQEVWLTDGQRRIRYVNTAAANSLGWTRAEMTGMTLADFNTAAIDSDFDPGRDQGRPFLLQQRTRAGATVPKEVRTVRFEIDGELLYCSFAQDISERQRLQLALSAAEAQLRMAVEAFPGYVAIVDGDLRYLYVTASWRRQLQRPHDEVIGRRVEELVDAKRVAEWHAARARLRAGDKVQFERREVDASGRQTTHWVQYHLAEMPSAPGGQLIFAFATDITPLRQSALRLETVLERAGIRLWEWDVRSGRLLAKGHANVGATSFAAEACVEPGADPLSQLEGDVHADDRAQRRAALLAVQRGEAPTFECEVRVRQEDGHWSWLLERGCVLERDGDGVPTVLIGTLQDITPLKANAQALQRLNDELEARVEQRTGELSLAKAEAERASLAKTDFVSRMSHELRTPLNAILGFGQLLELSRLPGPEGLHVGEIMRAGHHLLQLIDEALDLAVVESGRIQLSLKPVPLEPLVLDCLSLLRAMAELAGLRLECCQPPADVAVVADRGRLQQVLLNLLSNAIKYNQRGGAVMVSWEPLGAEGCEIRVTDTGPGLTPEQIGRLFEPFERLDAGQGTIAGTGIGLSLSRRLVELMGGTIGVRSQPGLGSTFWLRLPRAPAVAIASAAERAGDGVVPAPTRRGRRRVLYVEDHPVNRRLMAGLLGLRDDVELVCCPDGESALRALHEAPPQLILMDIELPRMDGYAVLATLRLEGHSVPVVAVSAQAMPNDVARGLAAGFVGYLTKPLSLASVNAALETWLTPAEPPPAS